MKENGGSIQIITPALVTADKPRLYNSDLTSFPWILYSNLLQPTCDAHISFLSLTL
jgi:hypothetical protein